MTPWIPFIPMGASTSLLRPTVWHRSAPLPTPVRTESQAGSLTGKRCEKPIEKLVKSWKKRNRHGTTSIVGPTVGQRVSESFRGQTGATRKPPCFQLLGHGSTSTATVTAGMLVSLFVAENGFCFLFICPEAISVNIRPLQPFLSGFLVSVHRVM